MLVKPLHGFATILHLYHFFLGKEWDQLKIKVTLLDFCESCKLNMNMYSWFKTVLFEVDSIMLDLILKHNKKYDTDIRIY